MERYLSHEARELINESHAYVEGAPQTALSLPLCESTIKKVPSMNQEMGPPGVLNLPEPQSWIS
jgi:hypothetical protein